MKQFEGRYKNILKDKIVCFTQELIAEQKNDDTSNKSLVQQNIDLRRKLEEEHTNYKHKLQKYQEGQQRQAQLVQKLQAKVGTHEPGPSNTKQYLGWP